MTPEVRRSRVTIAELDRLILDIWAQPFHEPAPPPSPYPIVNHVAGKYATQGHQ